MLRHLLALAAGLALLAGCSAEPVADEDKIRIPTVSSPLGPDAAGNAGAEGTEAARPRPPRKERKERKARGTVVIADESGIRFTLPPGWTVLGAGQVDYAAEGDRIAALAERVGMSTDELRAMIKDLDAYAIGFSGNLNVAVVGRAVALPSDDEVRAGMSRVGTVSAVRDVRTPLGPARVVDYTLTLPTATNQGSALFVSVAGRLVQVSAATTDAGQTRALLDGVVRSLARA